jgi:hypothetical protein
VNGERSKKATEEDAKAQAQEASGKATAQKQVSGLSWWQLGFSRGLTWLPSVRRRLWLNY